MENPSTPGVGQRPLPLEDADAAIAGHPPSFYVRKARFAVLLGGLLHVAVFAYNLSGIYPWLLKILIPLFLGGYVFIRRQLTIPATATTGAFVGLGLGLLAAVIEISWYRQLWTVFNLVSEPLISLLVGFFAAGAIAVVFARIRISGGR